jgi:hypothetical protein
LKPFPPSYDPVDGKPDRRVQVLFTNGHVDEAIFIPQQHYDEAA